MYHPLYVKFQTERNRYIYDVATGALLEVEDFVYSIIDDFHRIPFSEIVSCRSQWSREALRNACVEMEENQRTNHFLEDHVPKHADEVGSVVIHDKHYTLEEFLKLHSSMIILGLTERCNLRCEYCCYSGHFNGWRAHGTGSMTYEIAQKAIENIFERSSWIKFVLSLFTGENRYLNLNC